MNDYIETKTFNLTALSPVHIKAGEADKDYGQGLIRLDNEKVYIIDAVKLQSELYNYGGLQIVERFSDYFTGSRDKSIKGFFDEIGFNYDENKIKQISKGVIYSPKDVKYDNKFIHTATGNDYFIPGSSVKGAIKTAVLWKMLSNNDVDVKNVLQDKYNQFINRCSEKRKILSELRDQKNKDWSEINKLEQEIKEIEDRKFATDFIRNYIQDTAPIDERSNIRRRFNKNKDGPIMDFFRAVKVSDSIIFKSMEKGIVKVMSLTNNPDTRLWKKDKNTNQEIEIKVEYFNSNTEISISIDHSILDSFKNKKNIPFQNIDELLDIASEFANKQLERERGYINKISSYEGLDITDIKNFYDNLINPSLRVGWGTGLIGTTVDILIDEPTLVKLRDDVISSSGGTHGDIAPKSRRFLIKDGKPFQPFGWIKLEEI